MPILPLIADSDDDLNKAISTFADSGVDYIVPGSISLFGNDINDSRVKYFNLVKKYYPEYYEDTRKLFYNNKHSIYNNYPSVNYRNDLLKRISKIAKEHDIKLSMFE